MKKIFPLLILTIFTYNYAFPKGYDLSVPLEGDSIASDSLQFVVLKDIYERITKIMPACYDFYVPDTQVIHYPYDVKKKNGKYVKGYWKELWTINACDKIIQFPLTFYIQGSKTEYLIENKPDEKNYSIGE